MLTAIHPKLPMRNKAVTKDYYVTKLGFTVLGPVEYDEYLMLQKDDIEIHFFLFKALVPKENYGQVYIRTNDIDALYKSLQDDSVAIHPNGHLKIQPWQQKEFSLLDPDNNLLTFGEGVK